ncbi:MAG TPA: MBL fold metallo-hydrolase [Solirubrobacteraceae bacterium]|nr:MBL fold metallo-hydrolase [Solirubrobacteraceae bacterium]
MGQVRVQFIGSGDAFASGGRFQACLRVEGGPEPLLIDCGATTLVALKRAGIDPASIGWVALSHLHGDHFAGIPWLILDGQFGGRAMPLEIAGPPGTQERVERTFEALYPGATAAARRFDTRYTELVAGVPCEFGPAVITPFEVRHESGSNSYALRVQYGGKVVAYSGDTEWTDRLIDAASGADLFVCECNFFDKQVAGHLDYRTLDSKHAQLGCERIVLTHMSDDMLVHVDEVQLETATDGAVIAL